MKDDQQILELYKKEGKQNEAFSLIVHQYQRPIYYYVRRMVMNHEDADDIAQNTFVKAWRALPEFKGDSRISTWLHRIAYNETMTFLKKEKRLGKVALDDVESKLESYLESDPSFEGDELQRKLQVAVATLPEKQKAVFIMKYYEEKKYDEMAEITGTSVGALKASFHLAVQKIETWFENYFE